MEKIITQQYNIRNKRLFAFPPSNLVLLYAIITPRRSRFHRRTVIPFYYNIIITITCAVVPTHIFFLSFSHYCCAFRYTFSPVKNIRYYLKKKRDSRTCFIRVYRLRPPSSSNPTDADSESYSVMIFLNFCTKVISFIKIALHGIGEGKHTHYLHKYQIRTNILARPAHFILLYINILL